MNQSLLNESIVSISQSKKNIIPSFKLDLSKCKKEEDFGNIEDGELEQLQNELQMQSMMGNEIELSQQSSITHDVNQIEIEMIENPDQNIDNMKIYVADDSYRKHQASLKKQKIQAKASPTKIVVQQAKVKGLHPELIEKLKKSKEKLITNAKSDDPSLKIGVKTVRNPTPVPSKQRVTAQNESTASHLEKKVNKTERIHEQESMIQISEEAKEKRPTCPACQQYAQDLELKNQELVKDFEQMKMQLHLYQEALVNIKKNLNLTIQFEFEHLEDRKDSERPKTVAVSQFANKVQMVFRRMYGDLEKERDHSSKLQKTIKFYQKKLVESQKMQVQQVALTQSSQDKSSLQQSVNKQFPSFKEQSFKLINKLQIPNINNNEYNT